MQKEANVIKASGIYNGHSIRKNFDVELKIRFIVDDISDALKFIAGIGHEMIMKAKVNGTSVNLGKFNVNKITVDKNLNCYISFMSNKEFVNLDEMNRILIEEVEMIILAKIVN